MIERVRVEVYIPDNPAAAYQKLLKTLEEEFTYAFRGSSILRGLQGSYLSRSGRLMSDRINLIYSDTSFALSTHFVRVSSYAGVLKRVVMETLREEAVLVSVEQVYHAV